MSAAPRIAMFLPSLEAGGAERMMVNLLGGLTAAQVPVDLLLARAEGALLVDVPADVRIIGFDAAHVRGAIPALARFLRRERPHALVSRLCHANVSAVIARKLARVKTRLVLIESSNLSGYAASGTLRRGMPTLMRWLYPHADQVVAVSRGVARDLEANFSWPAGRVRVIYNPVVNESLLSRAAARPEHLWLCDSAMPTFLSVGRLNVAKDFPTLLRALAIMRRERPARLVIFGEGEERPALERLIGELGLADCVSLPGYTANPAAAMRCASALVLSSRFEGLPSALVEALACGCPVVATNCPSGPDEILEGGKHGLLVPVGDPAALARGMVEALSRNWDREQLRRRGAQFSLAECLPRVLDVLDYPRTRAAAARAA